ncbi:MAG: hypothetical protein QOD00_2924 [Blastocatellia bacterium]|jgi:hypothetical protein|nr:hypothetical protein [Blastocatellia bacterium]
MSGNHKSNAARFAATESMRVITVMREAAVALNDSEVLSILNDLEEAIRKGDARKHRELMAQLERHTNAMTEKS